MSAAGRWFITPHAVRRYVERIDPRASFEVALATLIDHGERARFLRATTGERGPIEIWRGPRPRRLRFVVAPARSAEEKPQMLTCLFAFDRRPGA